MPLSGNELADEVPIGRLSHTKERNGTGQGMPGDYKAEINDAVFCRPPSHGCGGPLHWPSCLGDGDLKVRRPFIECISFLCRIGVAVIGANEFWRKVIKRRLCNVRRDLTSLGGSKSSNAARIQTWGTTWRLTRRASAGLGGNLALALTMTRGNLDHG